MADLTHAPQTQPDNHQLSKEVVETKETALTPAFGETNQNINPGSAATKHLTPDKIMSLQRMVGNQAVLRLLNKSTATGPAIIQRTAVNGAQLNLFKQQHPGHDHLLAGFTDGENLEEAAIIGKLLDNFHARRDFDYNGLSKAKWNHVGDCATLRNEFKEIAETCFGIVTQPEGVKDQNILIRGGQPIGDKDQKNGNVDGGAHWFFDSHFWLTWNGMPIDVLFAQLGVVSHELGNAVPMNGELFDKYEFTGGLTIYRSDPKKIGSASYTNAWTTNPDLRFKGL